MEALWQDLRYTARALLKNPGFTATAVLVLALGIGANTGIFSVVNSILLKPLPYRDPHGLVVALHSGTFPVSPADYLDYKRQAPVFEQMGAAQAWGGALTAAETEVISGLQVSADVMPMLGVAPRLGRWFTRDEDDASAGRVILLSEGLWQRRFGGDPQTVGRSITIDGLAYTVIGVMPPGFHFAPFWQTQAEMWTPLKLAARIDDRGGRSLRVFARLRPGISIGQAQAAMDTVASRLAAAYPRTNAKLG